MKKDILFSENKNNDITELMLNIAGLESTVKELKFLSSNFKISWPLYRDQDALKYNPANVLQMN